TRVSGSGYPSAGLDGPKLGVGEVLIFTRGIVPPAVVGDNSDKLSAFLDIVANVFAPDRFIANNWCCTDPTLRIKYRSFILAAIATRCATKSGEQGFHKRKSITERKLLNARN